MSLYKDASLVMLPSAVKDGKLYSIRPTDGSGDFTFSRGSNLAATRVDVNGLIEKGRENLLLQSNQFDTTWSKNNANVTGGQSGYDGTNNAWKIIATPTSSCYINQGNFSTLRTHSVYAKAGTYDQVSIIVGGYGQGVQFDLTSGTIATNSNSSLYYPTITQAGAAGWYRISVFVAPSAPTYGFLIAPQILAGGGISVGEYIYIQAAQTEYSLVATDYIETGASTAQAGILEDLPRLDYSGGASCPSLLLEPQRTNLAESSEQFNNTAHWVNTEGNTILVNNAISPEGVQNAFKLIPFATDAYHRIFEGGAITTGNPYTFSIFAKAGGYRYMLIRNNGIGSVGQANIGVDLEEGTITYADSDYDSYDIQDYGNGWYRIWASADAAQNTYNIGIRFQNYEQVNSSIGTFTGDGTSGGYVYGWQVEAGSYPTSYIPTYGSSVTRTDEFFYNYDDLQNNGILGSTWTFLYDQTYQDVARDAACAIFLLDNGNSGGDGHTNVRIALNSNGNFRLQDSSGQQYSSTGNKILCRYDGYKISWYIDGSLFNEHNVTGAFDTLNRHNPSGSNKKTIRANQVVIFPTALTDSEAIALTTL